MNYKLIEADIIELDDIEVEELNGLSKEAFIDQRTQGDGVLDIEDLKTNERTIVSDRWVDPRLDKTTWDEYIAVFKEIYEWEEKDQGQSQPQALEVTQESGNIREIGLDKLHHHPDNPRQDYRDIEELAQSIKENGVLQNLTVVPDGSGDYYVVIGNRRLEGALAAGLKTVPCSISDMDEKTQASTMLLENMQRSDLTPFEEAEGFQMCLDLGMSEKDLAKKTGLSKTTIKHRTELLKLDKEKLKEKVDNGVTLFDLMKLEKIKDPEKRNEVMENLGTNNFDYSLNSAIREQKEQEWMEKNIPIIESFAERIENPDYVNMNHYKYIGNSGKLEIPEDADETKYYFTVNYNEVVLYKERQEKEQASNDGDREPTEWQLAQQRREKKREEVNAIASVIHESRYNFFTGKERKELSDKDLFRFAANIILTECLSYQDPNAQKEFMREFDDYEKDDYLKIHGIESEHDLTVEKAVEIIEKNPKRELERAIYTRLETGTRIKCVDNYSFAYKKYPEFELLYEFLEAMGYRTSDVEKSLLDGTHPLYEKEEDEE